MCPWYALPYSRLSFTSFHMIPTKHWLSYRIVFDGRWKPRPNHSLLVYPLKQQSSPSFKLASAQKASLCTPDKQKEGHNNIMLQIAAATVTITELKKLPMFTAWCMLQICSNLCRKGEYISNRPFSSHFNGTNLLLKFLCLRVNAACYCIYLNIIANPFILATHCLYCNLPCTE